MCQRFLVYLLRSREHNGMYNFKRIKDNKINRKCNTQRRNENAYQNTVREIVSKKGGHENQVQKDEQF